MNNWTFTFDTVTGSASTFEGVTLIFWGGRTYDFGSAPIDLKQAVLSARK